MNVSSLHVQYHLYYYFDDPAGSTTELHAERIIVVDDHNLLFVNDESVFTSSIWIELSNFAILVFVFKEDSDISQMIGQLKLVAEWDTIFQLSPHNLPYQDNLKSSARLYLPAERHGLWSRYKKPSPWLHKTALPTIKQNSYRSKTFL